MGFYAHLNALNVLLQADEILKAVAEKMNKHSEDVVQLYEIQESGGKLERDSRLTAGSALAWDGNRAGARAVGLGEDKRLSGRPKFEIRHKSRCLQTRKLVNCGGQACRLGGRPLWSSLGAGLERQKKLNYPA